MTNSIERVLDYGYIVAADDETGCLVTWNGSATFNFWLYQHGIKTVEGYINTNVKTIQGVDLALAEKLAKEWLANPDDLEICHPCRRPTPEDEWAHGHCFDCAGADCEECATIEPELFLTTFGKEKQ
jgi:hypothetical protein